MEEGPNGGIQMHQLFKHTFWRESRARAKTVQRRCRRTYFSKIYKASIFGKGKVIIFLHHVVVVVVAVAVVVAVVGANYLK